MSLSLYSQYIVENPGCSALEIARHFKKDKKEVNRYLYSSKTLYMEPGTPPKWYIVPEQALDGVKTQKPKIQTYLFVDLGHMHNVFEQYKDEVGTFGFADASSHVEIDRKDVFKGKTGYKNEADVKIIWDVAQICSTRKNVKIIVATRDNGFLSLQSLVENSGNSLHFARSMSDVQALFGPVMELGVS